MSLPQLLNLGLSGIPFAGADIGGFYGNCEPELFARWMQLGAFYPLARGNSAKGTTHQEPWSFGPEIEDVCRRALEQRYRLLPYFATVMEEASRTGLPVLRPLFLHYPSDPATHRLHDQALVGRDLMIAPIVRPGKSARAVYLPSGVWFDVRSGERLCGPGSVLAEAHLTADIPLYARGGSVIPSGPPLQWTDEYTIETLTLDIFPDDQGLAKGGLYEDDGHSFAFERGERRFTRFTYRSDPKELTAQIKGNFQSPARSLLIRLREPHREYEVETPSLANSWKLEV
jgi:alpha-glucosidase